MIMKNSLREKLDQGLPTLGTHFLSPDPDLPEIIGDTGLYDYGEFCAEYASFDMSLLYHMARAGQCGNLPLMLKPDQANETFWAQAALGAGFKAVLFTDIRTPEDVWRCHAAIRPDTPEGGGQMGVKLRRAALSGYEPAGYLTDLSSTLFLIMIEKQQAFAQLDAILDAAQQAGVDMIQWGPADFGFSRGEPNLMQTPAIRPFETELIQKSLAYDIPPRIEIGAVDQAARYIDQGVRHFCIGWDRFILQAQLRELGEGMRKRLSGL